MLYYILTNPIVKLLTNIDPLIHENNTFQNLAKHKYALKGGSRAINKKTIILFLLRLGMGYKS